MLLTGVAASDEQEALVRAHVEAEQRRQGGVLLVPVEGPGLLAVPLVPVPCLPVRLRRRPRHPSPGESDLVGRRNCDGGRARRPGGRGELLICGVGPGGVRIRCGEGGAWGSSRSGRDLLAQRDAPRALVQPCAAAGRCGGKSFSTQKIRRAIVAIGWHCVTTLLQISTLTILWLFANLLTYLLLAY